ncbi:MAG: hypothetical protein CSA22_01545 [Deltaproteobacteria bacterium]|nr:MAG: hypothetical protein CSA22_01545 [Deltaproteobacteria bacterium]
MKEDLEDRLDAFFKDDEDEQPVPPFGAAQSETLPQKASVPEGPAPAKKSVKPLENLKAVILSMEWEINDEIMNTFIDEVNVLTQRYKGNRIYQLFLKLHDSIGKYIKIKKAAAHPSSIQFLNGLFESFESVVMNPEQKSAEAEKIILKEVNNFKMLKKRILLSKGGAMEAETASASTSSAPAPPPPVPAQKKNLSVQEVGPTAKQPSLHPVPPIPRETLDYLLEEIKRTIRAELEKVVQRLV